MKTGLVPDKENPALVAEVRENSRAAAFGFKVGDIVTQIECDYSGPIKFEKTMKYRTYYWFTITPKHIKEKRNFWTSYGEDSTTKYTHAMREGMIECLNSDKYGLLSHNVTVTVIRDKKKVKLYLQPLSFKFTRNYWLNNEQLKSVRK
jgi:hypothetical protein